MVKRPCSPKDKAPPKEISNKRRRVAKKPPNDGDTLWIDDDTVVQQEAPMTFKIFLSSLPEVDDEDDSDYYSSEEEVVKREPIKTRSSSKKEEEKIPIKLSKAEETYYKKQSAEKKKELLQLMSHLKLEDTEVPQKFKVLELPISDYMKSQVIKKINMLSEMHSDGGESHKLRNWIDSFLRIPFGKTIPLPVKLEDGHAKCSSFMKEAKQKMDLEIYGMTNAKTQILQVISQWIVNPDSIGNVIALQGDPGIGKTSFARNAIASVLERPFEFFSLGGSSDISTFVGHSYTYEGSLWGRIADSIMRTGTMNPVLYCDEVDKISTTPQGEEVVSMLIHLTDRSQNSQFHDRYFAGIDFDLSQCLFVFSFNEIQNVHPVLRDRMTIIKCSGYSDSDKKVILKQYIWNQLLKRLKFNETDLILEDDAVQFLISQYSSKEKGVRNLIRSIETFITRINMIRVTADDTMKDYKFYVDFELPFKITEPIVKKVLFDFDLKEPETWRTFYT